MNKIDYKAANKTENAAPISIFEAKPDTDHPGTKTRLLCELFVCLFLCGGSWLSLLSMINVVLVKWILYPLVLLVPTVLYLLFRRIKATVLFIYILLPIAAFYVLKLNEVWNGYLLIANSLITRLNELGFLLAPFATSGIEAARYTTMALIPLCILSAAVIAFGIIKQQRLLIIVFVVLPLLLGVALRLEPELPPLLLLLLGLFCFFAFGTAGPEYHFSGPKGTKGALFTPGLTIMLLATMLMALCFFVLALLFPADRYVPSPHTKLLKEQLAASVDALRYKNANSNFIYRLPFGDLNRASYPLFTENTALRVTMEKPHPLFLRTFTGDTYQNGKWSELPPEAYAGDYTGMLLWLQHHNFHPQIQLGSYLALMEETQTGEISIENIALSSKHLLLPYEALSGPGRSLDSDSIRFGRDDLVRAKGLRGKRQYSYHACLPPLEDYAAADSAALQLEGIKNTPGYNNFSNLEKIYRNFVYNRYLEIPPEESKLLGEFFSEAALDTMKMSDHRMVINMIRQYFHEGFSYALEVPPLSTNANFLESFWHEREGYEIHFATLATLLLREAGIPARYVEGYHLTPRDVDIYTKTRFATFDIPDTSAHAWTEIYENGVGWLPVEVTPGFYTLIRDQEDDSGEKDVLTDNPKYLYLKDKKAVADPISIPPPEEPCGFNRQLLLLSLILFVLFAATLLLRQHFQKRINRGLTQEDTRQAALCIYRCLLRLLRFGGLQTEGHTAEDILQQASEKYPPPPGIKVENILGYLYRARFAAAGHFLKKGELSGMKTYLHFLAEAIYKEKKLHRKILMNILCLRYPPH